MKLIPKESKISHQYTQKHHLGLLKKYQVILELSELPKTKPHPSTCKDKFHNILEHHPKHLYIFTNGSKDNNKTA